ncbi:MAG: Gfo/Idh/MocA family oxidoreductase [Schwartzia succinivorans]|nr:Gfo/Idh/MocA family oxidoreductase [Schwartzia succinivorans]
MNVVVIGLGSMGKRRVRLLRELYNDVQICGVDAQATRRTECEERLGVKTYDNLDSCLKNFSGEAAFICTPPLSHAAIIRDCLLHGMHIFSEINLVANGYDENIALAKEKGRILFLSSTPLYREEIKHISRRVKETVGRVNYSFHVGQYLPDWHPWDVLQDFFVSKKETNGCRELFAIELPWIIQTFGKVKKIEVMRHKATTLPIQYDDSYFVLLEHETGHHGVLIVDVASREAVRHLELFGENLFLTWDGTPDSLREKNLASKVMECVQSYKSENIQHEAAYSKNIVENAYAAEIKNFFAVVKKQEEPLYSFQQDTEILELIDRIEGITA